MHTNQKPVIYSMAVATVILLVVGIFGTMSINSNLKSIEVDVPSCPTASDIASKITIPEAKSLDNEKLNRVCELTEGCEYWEPEDNYDEILEVVTDELTSNSEDFMDMMEDLTGIDKDYLMFSYEDTIRVKDSQIRVYSDNDKDDENWNVRIFVKLKYYDEDDGEDEDETMYVLVESTLDEGDYDSMTITEVDRTFEF